MRFWPQRKPKPIPDKPPFTTLPSQDDPLGVDGGEMDPTMMQMLLEGKAVMGNRRPDGTWEVTSFDR